MTENNNIPWDDKDNGWEEVENEIPVISPEDDSATSTRSILLNAFHTSLNDEFNSQKEFATRFLNYLKIVQKGLDEQKLLLEILITKDIKEALYKMSKATGADDEEKVGDIEFQQMIMSAKEFTITLPDSYDFDKVPVLRGYKKIKHIFKIAKKHNAVICGGYVRYMVSTDENTVVAGDVDIFPETEETCEKVLDDLKKLGYTVKHENDMSYTMAPPNRYAQNPIPQVIKPVKDGAIVSVGEMPEILQSFDFTVTRAGLLNKYEALVDIDFMADERAKRLRIKNIHCPISSLMRVTKYGRKGYWIQPSEALKLFRNWENRSTEYKTKIFDFFEKEKLSKEEIDELEKLLNID